MANNKTVQQDAKKGGRILQIILSLLFLAGFVTFLFYPNAAQNTNLWTMVLNTFKGSYAKQPFLQFALYGIVAFYAVLLICTVISLFSQKNVAAACNFIKLFIAILAFAFFTYALKKELSIGFSEILLSDKTFVAINAVTCSLALALLGLVIVSFSAYKGRGFIKVVFALFAGAFFAFAKDFIFIENFTFIQLFGALDLGTDMLAVITAYAFTVLAWAIAANFVLALLALMLPRTSVLDLIRSIAVFVIAAASLILLGMHDSFANLFSYLGTVGVTAIALAQLIYAIVVVAVLHAKRKKREALEESAEEDSFVTDFNNQMAIKGLQKPAEAAGEQPAETPETQQPSAEQEAAKAAASQVNDALEDASQISIDDIVTENAEDATNAEAQEEIAAEEAVKEEKVEKEDEKPFDFEQAKYDGKFNRAYADFAEREEQQARPQPEQQQSAYGFNNNDYQQNHQANYQQNYQQNYQVNYQQNYQSQQTPPPYYGPNYSQPYNGQANYYNVGFIPDMFLSSLTPAERDEFDKLFISRIYGDNKRLPAYRIGGDNREFFTKIFVFMGRYRNVISEGLLEKIYNYSNSIK